MTFMDEIEARTRQELQEIITVLQELTGLPSQWSGRIELVPGADFKGKKRFSCDIQIDAALASQDVRWSTLIHEALHSFSAGYVRDDYQNFQGWEEGVVEQSQRFFRTQILSQIGVAVASDLFRRVDTEHAYNEFIEALETLRQTLGVPEMENEQFYKELLGIPIKERPGHVLRQGMVLPTEQRQHFLHIFSAASATLRTRRMEGIQNYDARG
jgi:hypothetical protein